MTATLGSFPVFRALDADGAPLVGGLLYSFSAGTLTPLATYVDAAGVTTNANPVVLDSTGSANVWFGSSSYKLVLKTSTGSTLWTVDNYQPDSGATQLRSDLASTASTALGDALVGVKQPFTGAVATTQHFQNSRVINVMDFGAKFDGITDDTAAINASTAYAYSLTLPTLSVGGMTMLQGGATVLMPPGKTVVSSTINVYGQMKLKGAGVHSTVITSSYDGTILTNADAAYGANGMGLEEFSIVGDRTKTSQTGIDLLRYAWSTIRNVSVVGCGGTGIRLRQCIDLQTDSLEAVGNVGVGLWVSEGVLGWTPIPVTSLVAGHVYCIKTVGSTNYTAIGSADNLVGTTFTASGAGTGTGTVYESNTWPSNLNMFTNGHFGFNDGPGVKLTGNHDGNVWVGGGSEGNYYSSGANTGYNVEIYGNSYFATEFLDFWCEGPCKAHVYMNADSVGTIARFTNLKHFGGGLTGGVVDRAVIVDGGMAILNGLAGAGNYRTLFITVWGTSTGYVIGKTVSNSGVNYRCLIPHTSGTFATDLAANKWVVVYENPSFRVNKAGGKAVIQATDVQGSGIAPNSFQFCEDENGSVLGLNSVWILDNHAVKHAPSAHYAEVGGSTMDYYGTAEAFPWLSVNNYTRSVLFGNGAATPTVGLYYGAGTPEAAVTAGIGSLFMRSDGGAGTSLYVKQTGTGNTGWVGK